MLELKNVMKTYGSVNAILDVSLQVKDREIVCILGPSGCGKTTLLNLISGLLFPDGGEVYNDATKVGYVFQEDRLIEWCNVFENVALVKKEIQSDKIHRLIEQVGLNGFEKSYPHELSGGMRQRCSIVRAFYYDAPLLLMDEPFKSLDYTLRIEMVQQMIDLWKQSKKTIVFVTHEIDEAIMLGNQVIILSKRPATVAQTLTITKPQHKRKLSDVELIEARNQVIQHLLG